MAFKGGVVLGTVALNLTGTAGTSIASTSNSGTVTIGNASLTAANIIGPTNINVAGTLSTAIGSTSNSGTVAIGNASSTSVTIIGPVNINTSSSNNTAINSTSNNGTVSIGNTSSGVITIACGTAGILVGTTANAHASTFGSTTASSTITIQAPSGGVILTGVQGVGVSNKNFVTINTSTGAIGSDAIPIAIASGGTNATSMATADGVVYYDGTRLVTTSAGVATQILTSNGPGVAPTYQASAGGITTLNGDSGSATGATVTIAGTANKITTSGAGSTITITIPSSPSLGGTTTVATGLTATSGDITISSGNILLPNSTSTTGIVKFGTHNFIHNFSPDAAQNQSNFFLGWGSGNFTMTAGADRNLALGDQTLAALTTGNNNCAFGGFAMNGCTSGFENLGIGTNACLAITSGSNNVGIGINALDGITTGTNNVALGHNTANALTTSDSHNIYIGSANTGSAGVSNKCRIGVSTGTGTGQLNQTFIAGITGIVVTGAAAIISSGDQLGVLASSKKYKNEIQDMADYTSPVLNLRPVTFVWNKESSPGLADATDDRQFGFIAEEVALIMPQLVNYDDEGEPFSFKYSEMPAILLNELQKALKRIEILEKKLGASMSIADIRNNGLNP